MILYSLLTGFIPHALAGAPLSAGEVINTVGATLPAFGDFNSMMSQIAASIQTVLPILATILLVYAGIRMVVSQEDNATENAKNTITLVVAGLIMAYLVEPFISAFGLGVHGSASAANDEIVGLADWFTSIALVVAVISVIITAIKALFSPDSEEGIGNLRKTAIAIVSGIVILGLRVALATIFSTGGSPETLIAPVFTFITSILAFIATVSVVIIIYAGFLLVTAGGNEENATKAKGIITRTLIGLLVIGFSYAIVNLLITKLA